MNSVGAKPGGVGGDRGTPDAYDRDVGTFADYWASQSPPTDMYETVQRLSVPGPTANVGCGAGRDTAWLAANDYPCIGFDASKGLLAEAQRRHPDLRFQHSSLPELPGVPDHCYSNVLCETVIMHLPPSAIG